MSTDSAPQINFMDPPEPGAKITPRGWVKEDMYGDEELLVVLDEDTAKQIQNHNRTKKARATRKAKLEAKAKEEGQT